MMDKLQNLGLKMEPEQDIAGFIGVLIRKNEQDGTMEITQTGIISCTIAAMGLTDSKSKQTPAEKAPLVADCNQEPCNKGFNFPVLPVCLHTLQGTHNRTLNMPSTSVVSMHTNHKPSMRLRYSKLVGT